MIKIPGQTGWKQNNRSDVLGTIYSSWNIDPVSNEGKLRVSTRSEVTTDDIANLGVAIGFERFNGETNGFSTVAGDRVFETASADPTVAFATSNGAATHSADTADIMFFRKANKLVTSLQTTLQSHDGGSGGSWSSVGGGFSMTSGTVHMLTQYGVKGYVTDDYKKIYSFDTSMNTTTSGASTFSIGTLDSDNIGLFISDILAASDRIWIFTINAATGQPCSTYTWDGATENDPIAEYVHEHGGVLAATLVNDVPYVMTAEAFLEVFNGGTFVKVPNSRLPVNPDKFLKNTFSSVNDRWIHPNGMISIENRKLNILIKNEYEDGSIEERMPSGVWEFDLEHTDRGWYHKRSLSLYAGSVTDYGQNRVSRVGGLSYVKTDDADGSLLMGAQVYSDASTTKEIIAVDNTDDDIQKFGYIVTPKIYSPNIQDAWGTIYVRHKELLDSADRIWVRYRTNNEDTPLEATITWASSTTFTTPTDVSAYENFEVEVLQGKGAGKCERITDVSESGGVYTVTVDSAFTGATSGTAKARFQFWKSAGPAASSQTVSFSKFPTEGASTWIQLKICMQFTGKGEIDDIIIMNKTNETGQ